MSNFFLELLTSVDIVIVVVVVVVVVVLFCYVFFFVLSPDTLSLIST